MIRPASDLGSVAFGAPPDSGIAAGAHGDYSAAARSADAALVAHAADAPDAVQAERSEREARERRDSRDDPGLAATLVSAGAETTARRPASADHRAAGRAGGADAAGHRAHQGPAPPSAGTAASTGEVTEPGAPARGLGAAPAPQGDPAPSGAAPQTSVLDPAATAADAKNRQVASDDSAPGAASPRVGGSPDPDAAPASALKLAAPRLAAASASGPEGGELKSTAQATALANAARNAPGEIARSVDLAALGSTLARALRRLVAAREDEGAAPAREGLVGERPALTVAVAGSVGPVVAPGAAALTSTAVSSPEAVVRSASVADAIASLHVDDRGVAIIRVERTALGAIEAHVARHGADVTVRLRAVDSEHQARLLHALPAVRRELDASELFIGRVDVRGDVPTDAFGRGASGQAQTGDTSDAPAWTDLADPEPVIGAPSPVARPARATHPQPGERRRLLVIA